MTGTTRKQLHEHIQEAVIAMAHRLLEQRREELATWSETAHEHVVIVERVDRNSHGRIDIRSTAIDVLITTTAGPVPLCTVRVRDLLDAHGQPIDAKATAREALHQLGYGIPDTPAELDEYR